MDNDPFAGKLGQWMLKCTSYWQSILGVGIPFIVVVRGITYVQFQMATRKSGAKYPYFFPSELIVDVCIVLFVSAVFCWLTRRLAELKENNQLPVPFRRCWLHRSRATCVLAMALWIYLLTSEILEMKGVLHPKADWLVILISGPGIWVSVIFAKECNQRLERLVYCILAVQMSIISARAVIPTSEAGMWFYEVTNATLCAVEIVLTGIILLRHFHTPMNGSDSREST